MSGTTNAQIANTAAPSVVTSSGIQSGHTRAFVATKANGVRGIGRGWGDDVVASAADESDVIT